MAAPPVRITCSAHVLPWLHAEGLALAATTYQTNRLFLIGRTPDGSLSGFERLFDRPMGLHATPERLTLATRYQLWRLDHALPPGATHEGYDRLYVPRRAHTTGELDVHDLAVDADGEVVFVNTLYSCLAAPSEAHSFRPVWMPPFISALVPEERCHLNGLAMREGRPAFVTALSRSDVAAGWRERRAEGGVVVDVASGEVVCAGLSMPHSPRWHRGRLWLLNSGTSELGTIDLEAGRFEPVVFLPGYGRGLAFHGRYAVVGLSKPRESLQNQIFSGLPLADRLRAKDAVARCGIYVVDLDAGHVAHWLQFEGVVEELYDVQVLPGVRRPMALGFMNDEIRRHVSIETARGVIVHTLATLSEDAPPPAMGAPVPAAAAEAAAASAAPSAPAPEAVPEAGVHLVAGAGPLAEIRRRYGSLLFEPALHPAPPLRDPLLAIIALKDGQPVGLALADLHDGGTRARLGSLHVERAHRNFGIGTALVERLEAEVQPRGVAFLEATYRTSWTEAGALERVLRKRGWEPPRTEQLLLRYGRAGCADRWVEVADRPLPEGYERFPWTELTVEARARIERTQAAAPWFPPELTPFQMEDRLEPMNSFGIRCGGEVVGWIITHRLRPDLIQFTSVFARADVPRYVTVAVMAEAVRRQCVAGVPHFACMVAAGNQDALRFATRRLEPYEEARAEIRVAGKRLR